MAKKAVGKVKSKSSKAMAQVIFPQRSPKTGAYTFQDRIMPTEEVPKFVAQRMKSN